MLGVRYIVYGNANDFSVSADKAFVNVNTVKAHIIVRVMDIQSGKIISVAKLIRASLKTACTMNRAALQTVEDLLKKFNLIGK